MIKQM